MSFLSSLMNALPGAAAQGLAWGIMAIGVYITFRLLAVARWPPAALSASC